jgi:FMN reductase
MRKKKLVSSVLGSPFPGSSSERIASLISNSLLSKGWDEYVIDLSTLPSDALLMKSQSPVITNAIEQVTSSDLIIPATPTYRATYTGLMKVFFDHFPHDSLRNKYVLPVQTGGSAEHSLTIEHGLAPMLRSLGALVLSNGIYAWGDHWLDTMSPFDVLVKMVDLSLKEVTELIDE